MWLKSAILIFCLIAHGQGKDASSKASGSNREVVKPAISVGEFITSHKIPDDVVRSIDEDESFEKKTALKDTKNVKKANSKLEYPEKRGTEGIKSVDSIDRFDNDSDEFTRRRQAHVELESFSDAGVLEEDGVKKVDVHRLPVKDSKDSVLPGVYVSNEYPTTMMPILTTPREARSYDFVPVNIIREDDKDAYASFSDRHFDDLGDVGLVPACTNTRIEVKKGPDGKDYEYEYVYYYYDEDEDNDGKTAGTSGSEATKNYETNSRTSSSPRRSGQSASRSKYGAVERSTVEPASNEVVPNRGGNRGRQLVETDDVSEERLPANTRFPPRSRSNHNTGTTEATRVRGNRPRPGLDLVDSSSFRTHQEGPEFPQVLPKGPVRFLGVTPNEDNEEKSTTARGRGRYRVQETAAIAEEASEIPATQPVTPVSRRRPVTVIPEVELELNKDQSSLEPSKEEVEPDEENVPSLESSREKTSVEEKEGSEETELSSSPVYSSTSAITTENPATTEYPPMDKVALDLYAFSQQGQNNLMDSANVDAIDSSDATTTIPSDSEEKDNEDDGTMDLATTTELSGITAAVTTVTTTAATTTTTEPTTTTTTTEPTTTTTTTTTTTETPTTTTTVPSTTTVQATFGRGKFRRPGVPGGGVGTRNRFKSANGNSASTTEASPSSSAEPTQRTRARFGGGSSNNGGSFKRPRPGQKTTQPAPTEEEAVQKESVSTVAAEKPSGSSSRGRFRGSVGSRSVSTTPASTGSSGSASNGSDGRISRPSFNKLNINRQRGRPAATSSTPSTTGAGSQSSEDSQEDNGQSPTAESATVASTVAVSKPHIRSRLPAPGGAGRPPIVRPHGVRPNLRQKPGAATTSTTTLAPESAPEGSLEEPAGEGTEEETHEAPAETSPPAARPTTVNPLNKLRNRNRLQVHPKATTKAPSPVVGSRRSPLLPRRKPSTEAPAPTTANAQTSQEETSDEDTASSSDPDSTTDELSTSAESSTAASTKHEETRGFGGLLAPRRRIAPRRPGQIVSRE